MQDSLRDIQAVFGELTQAVRSGETPRFQSIALQPHDPVQLQLFQRNSDSLNGAGLSLRLREIEQEGGSATVFFDVVDADGQSLDEGEIAVVCRDDRWLIEEL